MQPVLYEYPKAMSDFDQAERHLFEDKCSLFIARGGVRRLLGRSEEAAEDYMAAYDLLDRKDKVRLIAVSFAATTRSCCCCCLV